MAVTANMECIVAQNPIESGFAIDISPDRILINGTPIASSYPPKVFRQILGKPDRIIDAAPPAPIGHRNNQVHMYDTSGLYLNEHHYTYQIQGLTVVLWCEECFFKPENAFQGALTVGGISVEPGISERQLLQCSIPFQSKLPGIWSSNTGPVHISFESKGRRTTSGRRSKNRIVVSIDVSLKHDPWDNRLRPE